MKVMWHGTASISIDDILLIDPFIPLKNSPVKIDSSKYNIYKHILITHGHLDHIVSIPEIVKHQDVTIYGTKAVKDALSRLHCRCRFIQIEPGNHFQIDGYTIRIYKSKHTVFDQKIIKKTFLNRRILNHFNSFMKLGFYNLLCKENHETIGYYIEKDGKTIFVLGSLNIDAYTIYPENMDLLILPYQGTSELEKVAKEIIERFKPKQIFLDHFDDTFPPISNTIDTTYMEETYHAIKPDYQTFYIV